MPVDMQGVREFAQAARNPRELVRYARGNIELWANLFVIGGMVAFMLWQGVGFAVIVGTVFAIWAILAVSLNLVVGFTGLLSVGHIGFFGLGRLHHGDPDVEPSVRAAADGGDTDIRLAVLRGAAGVHRAGGVGRPAGGRGVQPVPRRHLRAGLLRVRHHRVQRVSQPEERHPRGIWNT